MCEGVKINLTVKFTHDTPTEVDVLEGVPKRLGTRLKQLLPPPQVFLREHAHRALTRHHVQQLHLLYFYSSGVE